MTQNAAINSLFFFACDQFKKHISIYNIFSNIKTSQNYLHGSSHGRKTINQSPELSKTVRFSDEQESFTDIVLGFMEEEEEEESNVDYIEDEEDEKNSCSVEENRKFWKFKTNFYRQHYTGLALWKQKFVKLQKNAAKETKQLGLYCRCYKPLTGDCRNCLQREISLRLQTEGYNCTICKSKWKSSQEIPSGEHTFLEVVEKLNSKKGEIRVVIELNFRAEFEMARASEDYNRLINKLPEIFVGKAERLTVLIKILCSAGKKCMKEKKMHLGPWRKHKYMQSKWLGTCDQRTTLPAPVSFPVGFSGRPVKPKASLLTYDLLETTLPVLHCTAVKVL